MSGVFKNFDKLVSAQVFSGLHKLLIRPDIWRFNSANVHYDPNHRITGLPQGHTLTAFSLASVSSALIHEVKLFEQVEQTEEVQNEIELNLKLSAQYTREALRLVNTNNWNGEVETTAGLLYTLSNNILLSQEDKETLLPYIIKNAKYLSTQNIVDVVISLKEYSNTTFWNSFLDAIQNKEFTWNHEQVEYNGWTTNQYFYYQGKQCTQLSNTNAKLQSFKGGQQAKLVKLVNDIALFGLTSFWWPIVQKEKRVKYVFGERVADRDAFKQALQQVSTYVPGQQIENLLRKA